MFSNALKHYDKQDFVIQLKAKFLFHICIAILATLTVSISYSAYIQLQSPAFGYKLDPNILLTELGSFMLISIVLYLLLRGYFTVSAHLIIIVALTTGWMVLFIDRSIHIGRLDTIAFILATLSMTPLVVSKHKRVIILYSAINIIILFTFIYLCRDQFGIPDRLVLDYLADNIVAIFFIGVTSYNVFSINKKALDRAEHDIRERKSAEKALKKSEELYRLLAENVTDVIWTLDMDLNFTYVSPSIFQLSGFPVEETMVQSMDAILTPESVKTADEIYKREISSARLSGRIGQSSITRELEMNCKDGSTIWTEAQMTFLYDPDGKPVGIHGVSRDITYRKQAEETLRESEDKFRTIFENANDEIIYVGIDGTVIDVNDKVLDIFGYRREEIIGRNYADFEFFKSEDMEKAAKLFMDASSGKVVSLVEFEALRRDKTAVYIEVNTRLIEKNGEIKGFIHIVRDITDRKQAKEEKEKLEAQLIQSQKMEAIGTLAGGIAHDFNNILAAIMGYTEIALGYIEKGAPFEKHLHGVLKAGNRAKDLVMQILTFSRQTDHERKPVQVKIITKEALKLLRASLPTTINIQNDIQSDSTTLADPTQVHQILMNLCTNAGHAMMDTGGDLAVSLTDVVLDSSFSGKHPNIVPGPYIKLTVSDTGHGISPDTLERIFDPYFTTKDAGEGTGLGLSVVHGIVKSFEGAITVESNPGKGTIFNIFFPIINRDAKKDTWANKLLPTGKERILFVDDEEFLVEIGSELLENLGYEVISKTKSTEALTLFKAQPDSYDLVITDMTMPGMTGDALSKELLKIRSDIQIILITGFSNRITKTKAEQLGIKAFLMKPLVLHDLANTVREVLDGKWC